MAKTPEIDLRDSLVGNNLIINGDMNIAQRGTSFVAPTSGYTLDRWVYFKNGAMVHTISQDSDVPTLAQSGYLFQKSIRLNLTTPDNSIASGEYLTLEQKIEGYNFRKIAQKPFTISFWVKSTATGIRNVAFRNSGMDRSYVAEYTINSANTWEKKSIIVSASPASGTWDYTNGNGVSVIFSLASGSTLHTTKDAWQVGNYFGTSAAVNAVATGSTDFRITGVMLNEGTEALPFSLAGGNFAGELQQCQRYYEVFSSLAIRAQSISTDQISMPIIFKQTKRVVPTTVVANTTFVSNSTPAIANVTSTSAVLVSTAPAGGGTGVTFSPTFDAEL